MYKLDYAEFYITNVCNLNCENCNRFNNFNFSGHERWKSHCEEYQQWSKILDINRIGILGGEPMLNPDFLDWVEGVAELWPQADITVITNGTQLHRWPEFYNLLCKYQGRVHIRISEHNDLNQDQTFSAVEKFFPNSYVRRVVNTDPDNIYWKKSYSNVKDPSWPDCNTPEEFVNLPTWIQEECHNQFHMSLKIWQDEIYSKYAIEYADDNFVTVLISPHDAFYNSIIDFNSSTQELSLSRSDPNKAIEVCYWKKCHHFIKGKLYKCGPVGILPEFIKQFNVTLQNDDQELINSYVPAQADWTSDQLGGFIQNLVEELPVAQCTFCPEQFVKQSIRSTTKKIKLIKKFSS